MAIRNERRFISPEALGRRRTYLPGTTLPSERSLAQYAAGADLPRERLKPLGGNTRRQDGKLQRFDGNDWREVS